MEAAFGGQAKIVELLISCGANQDASDTDGWTALMEAASKGQLEIVRILLANGARVNSRSNNGLSAVDVTARGHFKISNLLREAADAEIQPASDRTGCVPNGFDYHL